ncbi:hypothetical protein BDQ17DRAFT_1437730 [Cyathus striatus]|nr:hypothetical protein BDQ17DRAFT_1437730 [Cyathus striatus]
MPSQNSKKSNNTPVSPPTSHSGLTRTEPPASKSRKCPQSGVDTTAEPATKKPAITADEETVDNSEKQGKKRGGRGRGGKLRGRGGRKTAGDKDKEDEAASNAANKEKSKVAMKKLQEMSISIAPPMQPKTAGASEISRASEIAGTSEILATTPSQSSDSENNNSEVEHASETEGITQDNNEENEDDTEDKDGDSNDNDYDSDDDVEEREDMVLDENNSSLAQIEEEDVDTMDIDSTLVSDTVPTKEDLKGASRTTGGIFWGRAQGNNFRFADNMNESSSMVVDPQGFVYITVSDDSPKFNPTLLNTEAPPQAVPTTVNSCLKSVLDSVAKRMPMIKLQNRLIMNFDTECDTWIIFGHFNDIETRSVGSSFGSSTTTKSSEGASGSGVTDENLDIPDGLTKKQELIISIYQLVDSSPQMWPSDMDKPLIKDLHTMFGAAGTAWHHWDKVLKFISNYPDMEEWLNSATPPDNKATSEIWRLKKTAGFTRADLESWIKKKKGISAGKGKQKAEGGKSKKGSGIKNKWVEL